MGELGDAIGEGRGLENIGNVLSLKNDWDGALDMFKNALAIMEKMENRPGMAQQNEAIGDILRRREFLDDAEEAYKRASSLFELMKEPQSVERIQEKLLAIISNPKYLEKMEKQLREDLKAPDVENDKKRKAVLLGELGNVLFLSKNLASATEVLKDSLTIQQLLT